MQPNRVKAALRGRQAVFGPMITEARSVGTIKIMGLAGYDFVFLDSEHAMLGVETIADLVQMALTCNICPLVRVTDLAYPLVARALDAGAQGVIIPRVETRDQAGAAVGFAKYPPLGRRGAGGDARNGYERRDAKAAIDEANAETMVIVQIETLQGVENLVLITAHTSGATPRYWDRGIEIIAANVGRYRAGEPLLNEVDLDAGY